MSNAVEKQKEFTEDDFDALEPIKNHFDDNASLDGHMFETFGEELDYVKSMPENRIWTYHEEDGVLFLASGYHFVNRLGYLITTHPYEGEYTTITLHEYGRPFPVEWEGEGNNDGLIYGIEYRVYENYINGAPDLSSHCEIDHVEWFATKEERDLELEEAQ